MRLFVGGLLSVESSPSLIWHINECYALTASSNSIISIAFYSHDVVYVELREKIVSDLLIKSLHIQND